jgi:lysozyme
MARISKQGLDFIKSFESFVPYVYDDLRAPVKGKYREWKGEKPIGTLTIGYGHTNSAKHPLKIKKGLKITEAEAADILDVDLDECEAAVNELVDCPLTQGQFDALTSFAFNCGTGNLKKLIIPLKRKDYGGCRAKFDLYTKSKGQYLRGLQRRRDGEQALWDEVGVLLPTEEPVHHPAEVDAPDGLTIPAADGTKAKTSVTALAKVSRKARIAIWIERVGHAIWGGLTVEAILEYFGFAQSTISQVKQFVGDNETALLITGGILMVLVAKWLLGLMTEDVDAGRAVPSGEAA